MPLPPPNPATPPLMTARDIIGDAMTDIGVLAQGTVPSDQDVATNLRYLNRLFDSWAARSIMAFNVDFTVYTLIPDKQIHTIGPETTGPNAADWQANQRPVRIESASLILNAGPPSVEVPLMIRDDDWWADQTVKNLNSTLPSNLYYSPTWPNGSLYFWPISSVAYSVRLETWGLLGNFPKEQTDFYLPPGYWDAVATSLALMIAPSYGGAAQVSPLLVQRQQQSMRQVIQNNSDPMRIQTMDFGMPRKSTRPDFNFLTGQPWGGTRNG